MTNTERNIYDQVILERRLRNALSQLNPNLTDAALEDAFRRLSRSDGATVKARNRALHLVLVNGVSVEYRDDGADPPPYGVSYLFEHPATLSEHGGL